MNNNALVAEKIWRARVRREVEIGILHSPGGSSDVSMFSGQVAGLAGLRSLDFTGVDVATLGRVKVGGCCGAVSVGGDGEDMDVVD